MAKLDIEAYISGSKMPRGNCIRRLINLDTTMKKMFDDTFKHKIAVQNCIDLGYKVSMRRGKLRVKRG
jgi:hypothetical protein